MRIQGVKKFVVILNIRNIVKKPRYCYLSVQRRTMTPFCCVATEKKNNRDEMMREMGNVLLAEMRGHVYDYLKKDAKKKGDWDKSRGEFS